MDNIKKLQDKIAVWLKPAPHLPVNGRKWLSENVWWLTAVGAVLSALSVYTMINATFFAVTVLDDWAAKWGVETGVHFDTLDYISVMGSALLLVAMISLMVMAIKPLRAMKRSGWEMMFLVYLMGVVSSVFSWLMNFTLGSIIMTAISAAIGAYFVFEIKSYFIKADK